MTQPAEEADWFRLENVDLGNGDEWDTGDHVGTVAAWTYPVADVHQPTVNDIARVQAAVRDGGPWRLDQRVRTEPWVGVPVAAALGRRLDPVQKKAIAKLIGDWIGLRYLKVVLLEDRHREEREYVEVGTELAPVAADPTSAATGND